MMCPKCGNSMIQPRYHRNEHECNYRDYRKSANEHLHYHCACGYDFIMPTHDTNYKRKEMCE